MRINRWGCDEKWKQPFPRQIRVLWFANKRHLRPRLRIAVLIQMSLCIQPFSVMDMSCKLYRRWLFFNRHRIFSFRLFRCEDDWTSSFSLGWFKFTQYQHIVYSRFLRSRVFGPARYGTECIGRIFGDSNQKWSEVYIHLKCSFHMHSNGTRIFTNLSR